MNNQNMYLAKQGTSFLSSLPVQNLPFRAYIVMGFPSEQFKCPWLSLAPSLVEHYQALFIFPCLKPQHTILTSKSNTSLLTPNHLLQHCFGLREWTEQSVFEKLGKVSQSPSQESLQKQRKKMDTTEYSTLKISIHYLLALIKSL